MTIQITRARVLPMLRSYQEVESALATGDVRVLEVDPYSACLRPDSEIPEKHRRRRDQAWELIAPLLAHEDEEFLISGRKRGPQVAARAQSSGRDKSEIYRYLIHYWQAGRIKNALLPAFSRCGGKGKARVPADPHGQKRGRPSKLAIATKQPIGINVDSDIERRFERGIKRFYETRESKSLRQAFQRTLEARLSGISRGNYNIW